MLKTLRLHNFRTFLNAELTFTNRHLVIGRNNSGKTNLCRALWFLGATARTDLETAVLTVPGGISEIANWRLNKNQIDLSCTCELPFEGAPYVYTYDLSLKVEPSSAPSGVGQLALHVAGERLVINGPGFKNSKLLENDGRQAQMLHEDSDEEYKPETLAPADATMLSKLYELKSNRRAIAFRRYLRNWHYFALSPDAIRFGWAKPSSSRALLGPLGDTLATVLYQEKNFNDRLYRHVLKHTQLVEPSLEAINFFVSPDQAATPFVELRNRPQASWVGLSDGTLRCLALAFIIELVGSTHNADTVPAPLVMIEEPENGIYPGQLRRVFDLFEERAPQGQFVFTSHSPYFIDLFDAFRESVTLLRREEERTKVLSVPPPEEGSDRPMLSEEYSMELLG